MAVNETIMNYLKERLNNEELKIVNEFTSLSEVEYDTLEDFKEQLNSDAIASYLKSGLEYTSGPDGMRCLQNAIEYAQHLICISKKLFQRRKIMNKSELIEALKKYVLDIVYVEKYEGKKNY